MSLSFEPLSPTAFLDRSACVHADRLAIVDGQLRLTYAEFARRCRAQAGMLVGAGVRPGDRVAVLAPNGHLALEAHYGSPYAGAILVTLNTRLTAAELRYIVEHSGCRLMLHDPELGGLAREISAAVPDLRLVDGGAEYERLLAGAEPTVVPVEDECGPISLNYTSGTTGRPKGVLYHHRGAYLQSLAMVNQFGLSSESVYLWTLPMFHCNGWCFTWAVTAAGGTHVCVPRVDPELVWQLIADERVTSFCGAPTVLSSLLAAPGAAIRGGPRIRVAVGGAPPSPALLERCADAGLDTTHLYGLTETFGPAAICEWQPEWDALQEDEQARLRARQGVPNLIGCRIRVVDEQSRDVPADGVTVGEVAMRGNNLMLGYYRDEEATRAAAPDGWFRTGDLGVLHPDGYLEIRDRAKDVIISGGENISSVEVEAVLAEHPAVLESAVVAVPDDHWGERPAALVTLRDGADLDAPALRGWMRDRLAHFKVPDHVEFGPLPKTASGKIRKAELRKLVRERGRLSP